MPVATPAATLGSACPDFRLPDVHGHMVARDDFSSSRALLVVFFCNHCPYAKAVEGRVIELAKELAPVGLQTVLICSNDPTDYPDDAPEQLRARADARGYPFPYLVDATQDVARAFDAACTPDFFVFGPVVDGARGLAYRGRLDDSWKDESRVTRRELFAACRAVLAGTPPSTDQHPSLGCAIKWSR